MRVQADTRVLDVTPGSSVDVNLDVVNTTEVIDGVTARIIGLGQGAPAAIEEALSPCGPAI